MRTSQHFYYVLKLEVEVWVVSGIPMPASFTPHVVHWKIEYVTSLFLYLNRYFRILFLVASSRIVNRGPTPGMTCWTNCHLYLIDIVNPEWYVWGCALSNTFICFIPATQVYTFSSNHPYLYSSDPTTPLSAALPPMDELYWGCCFPCRLL